MSQPSEQQESLLVYSLPRMNYMSNDSSPVEM